MARVSCGLAAPQSDPTSGGVCWRPPLLDDTRRIRSVRNKLALQESTGPSPERRVAGLSGSGRGRSRADDYHNLPAMRAFAPAVLLLNCLFLGGCATSTTGSSLMDARAEAPAPKTSGYPAVEDLPPKREKPALTVDERLKLQKELTAARDRQTSRAKAKPVTASPPTKP
jgi:hypothetical protein